MMLRKVIWTVRIPSDQNVSLGREPASEVLEVRGGRRYLEVSTNEVPVKRINTTANINTLKPLFMILIPFLSICIFSSSILS